MSVPRKQAAQTGLRIRLAPEGHLERYFADKIEGYLRIFDSFTVETPEREIRAFDLLLRASLRELRELQCVRYSRRQSLAAKAA